MLGVLPPLGGTHTTPPPVERTGKRMILESKDYCKYGYAPGSTYNLSIKTYADGCISCRTYNKPIGGSKKTDQAKRLSDRLEGATVSRGCRKLNADGDLYVIREDEAVLLSSLDKKYHLSNTEYVCPVDSSTPFGEDADYIITNDAEFFRDCRTPEQIAADQERSERESVRRAKNTVEDIARGNLWDFFVTLTFDGKEVDRYDYYACTRAIKLWCDCLRHRYPGVRYVLVPELHKDGAYHFHGLIAGADLRIVRARSAKTGKLLYTKRGEQIYNIPLEYKYGLTTVTKVRDTGASSMYITKYIGKAFGEVPKGCHRYFASNNLNRPEDITEKMLIEDAPNMMRMIDMLGRLADRVRSVYVPVIDTVVTYFSIFAGNDWKLRDKPKLPAVAHT